MGRRSGLLQQLSRAITQALGVDGTMGMNTVARMLRVDRLLSRAVIRPAPVARSFLPGGISLVSRGKASTVRHIRQLDLRGRRISIMHVCHKCLTREEGEAEQQQDGSASTKHDVLSGRINGGASRADIPTA